MSEPGFYSLIPVIITLILSIWSRNVILGLFLGVFSGVLLLNGPNPFTGMSLMIDKYLIAQASNSANVGILMLMIFVAGLVGLMEKSGGAAAFAGMMTKFITSKGKAQTAAWTSGSLLFFYGLRHASYRRAFISTDYRWSENISSKAGMDY